MTDFALFLRNVNQSSRHQVFILVDSVVSCLSIVKKKKSKVRHNSLLVTNQGILGN